MMFDPLYMAILFIGFVLSAGASLWTKSTFARYAQVGTSGGRTGAEIAAAILQAEGVRGVHIERVGGFLSDHYDPRTRTLRLSPDVHDGRSVSSAGVAAHEVGHALQHAHGYLPMKMRQVMVPVANIGTNLGLWIMIIGLAVGLSGLATVGVVLFGGFVVFTLVTLPVELDASFRARRTLEQHGLLGPRELAGVSHVLTAAAATYLAAAVAAVLQLLYWLMRLGIIGGRRD
jgi:Zn-dependent membrane protease YugP